MWKTSQPSELELFGIVLSSNANGKVQSRVQFATRVELGRASWAGIGGQVVGYT